MRRVAVEFAAGLRAARAIRGLTRKEVADVTGVPVWRLSAFEKGASVPQLDELGVLWRCLTSDPPQPREANAGEGQST